jgi:hypothetical protein
VVSVATNTVITTIPVGNNPSGFGQFIQPPEIFAGIPGKNNCVDQSTQQLTKTYGDLISAASALGFSSVTLMQNALTTFCAEGVS